MRPRNVHPAATAWLLVTAFTLCAAASAEEPAPYRLQVHVEYGHPVGPGNLLDDLEYSLVAALRSSGCFLFVDTRLEGAPQPDDLELRVTLNNYVEDVSHETRVGGQEVGSSGHGQVQRRIARVSSRVQVGVQTLVPPITVRTKRLNLESHWRPLYGEDPREKAQTDFVQDAVRSLRSFVCKGSPAKWAKQLEQARALSEAPTR